MRAIKRKYREMCESIDKHCNGDKKMKRDVWFFIWLIAFYVLVAIALLVYGIMSNNFKPITAMLGMFGIILLIRWAFSEPMSKTEMLFHIFSNTIGNPWDNK